MVIYYYFVLHYKLYYNISENLTICSLNNAENSPFMRIINGVKPKDSTWSWLVRLQFQDFNSWRKRKINNGLPCGGTIIHNNWILTAGHCCDKKYIVEIHFEEKFEFIIIKLIYNIQCNLFQTL